MRAIDQARRVALVADALADIGVEPLSMYVHGGTGEVSVVVEADDLQDVIDRLGLDVKDWSDGVASGDYADVKVWVQTQHEVVTA